MLRRKSATDLSLQVAAFAEHCRKSGLSLTRQRLAIFEALAASREHPSAEDLHRAVRKRIPHLSWRPSTRTWKRSATSAR